MIAILSTPRNLVTRSAYNLMAERILKKVVILLKPRFLEVDRDRFNDLASNEKIRNSFVIPQM